MQNIQFGKQSATPSFLGQPSGNPTSNPSFLSNGSFSTKLSIGTPTAQIASKLVGQIGTTPSGTGGMDHSMHGMSGMNHTTMGTGASAFPPALGGAGLTGSMGGMDHSAHTMGGTNPMGGTMGMGAPRPLGGMGQPSLLGGNGFNPGLLNGRPPANFTASVANPLTGYPLNWAQNNSAQQLLANRGRGAGADMVNTDNPLESLSGLPYLGFLFGGTTNGDRDVAVDKAIQAGNLRNYKGSKGTGVSPYETGIGTALRNTVGGAGLRIGEAISNVPFLGRNIRLPLSGTPVSVFNPILNVAFGQRPMTDGQIRRNAIYNFGPRADAFESRGDSFGTGVAQGLRGTQTTLPDNERIPLWDDAMEAINDGLGFVSGLNLPIISFGADALRSFARGAKGDSTYDWISGDSRDPMDPTFTVFGSPANFLTSMVGRALAPVLGLDQEAMNRRFGRAIGDAMNVYDVFLPGDHTLHAWGSFFPRAFLGSSDNGNQLHGHVHQNDVTAGDTIGNLR